MRRLTPFFYFRKRSIGWPFKTITFQREVTFQRNAQHLLVLREGKTRFILSRPLPSQGAKKAGSENDSNYLWFFWLIFPSKLGELWHLITQESCQTIKPLRRSAQQKHSFVIPMPPQKGSIKNTNIGPMTDLDGASPEKSTFLVWQKRTFMKP